MTTTIEVMKRAEVKPKRPPPPPTNRTHGACAGGKNSPMYALWSHMKDRCLNENNTRYKSYGGRGITVCERWMDFQNFLSDMGERPEGMTLDRIDNDKGYSPDNCRWATNKQQQRNKTNNKLITYKGETKTLADWADDLGLDYYRVLQRMFNGWEFEDAIDFSLLKNPKVPASLSNRNRTGHLGVSFHKASKKYVAKIYRNRKSIHLGLFDNIEDAVAARKASEKEYGNV